jgi:hypothetical protein
MTNEKRACPCLSVRNFLSVPWARPGRFVVAAPDKELERLVGNHKIETALTKPGEFFSYGQRGCQQQGVRVANVEIADTSEELKYEDRFVWVGLFEPDEKLLREIQEEFCLHDLAIEDAHSAHQRPKLS